MVYVTLSPLRVDMAYTPEKPDYTSIQEGIQKVMAK